MSVFTNSASSAQEGAAQYVAAVLQLLGDRLPLDVLAQTTRILEECLREMSTDQLLQPEAVDKWSVRDVLQHLADSELVWGYRLRMTLTRDRPRLESYDQDRWASQLRYADADPQQALDRFAMLREWNLALLRQASESDCQRVAVHAERGEQTIDQMTRLYAGHDLVHLNQIARIKAALDEIGAARREPSL